MARKIVQFQTNGDYLATLSDDGIVFVLSNEDGRTPEDTWLQLRLPGGRKAVQLVLDGDDVTVLADDGLIFMLENPEADEAAEIWQQLSALPQGDA